MVFKLSLGIRGHGLRLTRKQQLCDGMAQREIGRDVICHLCALACAEVVLPPELPVAPCLWKPDALAQRIAYSHDAAGVWFTDAFECQPESPNLSLAHNPSQFAVILARCLLASQQDLHTSRCRSHLRGHALPFISSRKG